MDVSMEDFENEEHQYNACTFDILALKETIIKAFNTCTQVRGEAIRKI